jgi:hypothetical protein
MKANRGYAVAVMDAPKLPDDELTYLCWRRWLLDLAALSIAGIAISVLLVPLLLLVGWWIVAQVWSWWLSWMWGSGGQLGGM